MPLIPPQIAQIDCPSCGTRYRVNITTVLDVGDQPQLKQALLAGQLNVASCPQCGYSLMLGSPLIYHDHQKELFLAFFPQELSMSTEEQERFIGEATSLLMSGLPADVSRAYLLTPRRFMSLTSLIDVVLEHDGVPREVMEQQRRFIDVIGQLLHTMGDEEQFTSLVTQYQRDLTPEFFAMLEALIEASHQERREDSARSITQLRDRLVELTGFDGISHGAGDPNLQTVIDHLIQMSDEALEEAVAEHRAAIDYTFFQLWTKRIEQAQQHGNQEQVEHLTRRRAQILETAERLDRELQEMLERSDALLQQVLQQPDLEGALRNLGDQLDESFMTIVSLRLASLQQGQGHQEAIAQLEAVTQTAIAIIQERLPPDERLINELLLAPPEESGRLLRQHSALVTVEFVKKLNELADEQEKRGMPETVARLRQIAREAGPLLF